MYSQVYALLFLVTVTWLAPTAQSKVIGKRQAPLDNTVGGGGLGASASWGGYSASAGLGGNAGGGGLFADANAPGATASAGASSGASAAGAGVNYPTGVAGSAGGGGFFDKIFNIPISVLHSVNAHLNNKGKPITVHGHGSAADASAVAGAGADGSVGFRTADTTSDVAVGVRKNYDTAFAIPIAALTSVNKFLNGKK